MKTGGQKPERRLERLGYVLGARLACRDLADARDYEPGLLTPHVRGLHGACGVAEGLAVVLAADDRHVTVQPGIAFDEAGRALVLTRAAGLPAPPAAALPGAAAPAFDLVLAREAERCPPPREPCPGFAAEERPAPAGLAWRPARRLHEAGAACRDPGRQAGGVALARFSVGADGRLTRLRPDRRRAAPALARPYVAAGAAGPGELNWLRSGFDLRAVVDTREAGFSGTPVYLARLAARPAVPFGVIGPFVSVGAPSSAGFRVHLLFAGRLPGAVDLSALQEQVAGEIRIVWAGIEDHRRCAAGAPPAGPDGIGPVLLDPASVAALIAAFLGGSA